MRHSAGIALVTGAAGFVGNNLVRILLQQGRRVRALINKRSGSLHGLDIEVVAGDVSNLDSLVPAFEKVDVVYHLAGKISIDDGDEHSQHLESVNVRGTANVVQLCLERSVCRLIHFSSIHALSWRPMEEPVDEQRALAIDPDIHLSYDRSKANGERLVLDGVGRGLNAVILNPVGIFGPHDYGPSPTGELLQQIAERRLPGLVNGGYYWVDVRDVARAAIDAEHRGRCGERYVLAGEYASFRSIAGWVQEVTGSRPPRIVFPLWLAKTIAPLISRSCRLLGIRPLIPPESIQIICCHQNIKTSKARDELGFSPRLIRESVHDAICWLRESGHQNQG